MKARWLFAIVFLCGSPVSSQVSNRTATRAVAPQQLGTAVSQSFTQTPVTDEPAKATAANPVSNPKSGFVGKLPAIPRTFVYPPGEGKYKFEAAGLTMGDDGYYSPAANLNGFFMWFPPSALGMPMSLNCSVRGQGSSGTLDWITWGGGQGGGVPFRFGPSETETHYQTNFTNGDASLVMMKLWVPPGAGLKECRVTGTFEQE